MVIVLLLIFPYFLLFSLYDCVTPSYTNANHSFFFWGGGGGRRGTIECLKDRCTSMYGCHRYRPDQLIDIFQEPIIGSVKNPEKKDLVLETFCLLNGILLSQSTSTKPLLVCSMYFLKFLQNGDSPFTSLYVVVLFW